METLRVYRKYRWTGIALISLVIPLFFWIWGKCSLTQLPSFVNEIKWSLITTVIVWLGCEWISRKMDVFIPWIKGMKRRLWIQLAVVTLYAVLVVLVLGTVFLDGDFAETHFYSSLVTTVIVTWLVNLLGIIQFFLKELEASVLENALLKEASIASKFESLKSQVNPHFLFNSLNTLAGLIEENSEAAVVFVNKMAKVYRYLLLQNQTNTVILKDELDFLKAYIYLNQVRFGEALQLEVDISAELQSKLIPNLSLQMLVENAIKHNIILPEKPLKIEIYVEQDYLVVRNNLQIRENSESNGIGLSSICQRYKVLTPEKEVYISSDNDFFIVKIPLI